jgi:hypothetical protein
MLTNIDNEEWREVFLLQVSYIARYIGFRFRNAIFKLCYLLFLAVAITTISISKLSWDV